MTRTGPGPEPRPGRVLRDEPPARLEQYRAGRATLDLASGDFRLSHADGRTVLLAVAPTPADSQVVRKEGSFERWTRKEWKVFLERAEKFERSDLLRELNKLKDSAIDERISRETPVFDDDFGEEPMGVHSLLVHFSEAEKYLRVRGTATQKHRRELRSLGLRWNPSLYEWESAFSEDLLETASGFVERNGRVYNPDEIGYERCAGCGRWSPEGSVCPCKSRT